jgi:hypothetical protein
MKPVQVIAGVVGVFGLVGVVFLGAAMTQPDTTHIERSLVVAHATPADVYVLVGDFDNWVKWNPWQDLDPDQKTAVSSNPEGLGAWYTWEGNDDVGKGRMEIVQAEAPAKIVQKLEFIEPFQSVATVTFSFTPEGEGTRVVWSYDANNDLMSKAFGMMVDMDEMLGADFEKGLGRLAPLAEVTAEARGAPEAAAKAAADAAAAAPAVATDGTAPPTDPAHP